ncbi:hypothetical protein GCM10025787_29550 [Saccharopolyspora rosea]
MSSYGSREELRAGTEVDWVTLCSLESWTTVPPPDVHDPFGRSRHARKRLVSSHSGGLTARQSFTADEGA